MVLTDGARLVACRWDNSLYVRRNDPVAGAVVIASEPYDDEPGWQPVPDRSFVGMDDTGLTITPPGSPFDATTVEALP
jgi:gamma-glutamyl hercynylcysteine S-oxide hydrolase